ncbi:hypothetical protein PYW08_015627 [Mythimna loreyi]|uniref:Uncharacterized protein n=1 Tax=Mythimna loreyi TaxID=667449 RepID=A0ACC2QY62_9NEOP|nr:hypothetical protein PYW08_015627 [Mythimna loreyi]
MDTQHDTPCKNTSDVCVDTSYREMVQPFTRNEGTQQNSGRASDNCIPLTGDEPESMSHPQSAAIDVPNESRHTASPNVVCDVSGNKKSLADIVRNGDWKIPKEDKEWTLVQRKRLRNRFIASRGKAVSSSNSNFKAADIKIPIYIYNVAKDVPVCDILSYIASKTDVTVHLEKMSMKVPKSYDAYKVLVPKHKLETFLNDDFWPEGVAYRRFVNFNKK